MGDFDEEIYTGDDKVFDEAEEEADLLQETPEIRGQLDELEEEIVGPKVEDMTDEELREGIDGINEDTLEFLQIKEKSQDKKEAQRAKLQLGIYDDMNELMEDIKDWIDAGDFDKAEKRTIKFLDKVQKRLKKADVSDDKILYVMQEIQDTINLYGQVVENTKHKAGIGMSILSGGIELLPFVGGAKMMSESVFGKTMTGEKLSVKGRLLKMGEGSFWVVVDTLTAAVSTVVGGGTAGIGGVAVEAGGVAVEAGVKAGAKLATTAALKAGVKASKAAKEIEKAGGILRAVKGVGRGSKTMMRLGEFIVEHPQLAKNADRIMSAGGKVKKVEHIVDAVHGAKRVMEIPIDWAKRASVIHKYQAERQELMAALSQIGSD